MNMLDRFEEIYALDFEFQTPDGCRPRPLCMVAVGLRSGRRIALWADALSARGCPPFDIGPRSLFVAYYASAEMGCFQALGWAMPENVLALYAEFRRETNGLKPPCGNGLVGAMMYHGLEYP